LVDRILDLLKEKGVTAYKLTTDLGLPNSAVTDWKKGKAKPSTDAIIKIAEYFGVTTDYLLLGKKNNHQPLTVVENRRETIAMYNGFAKDLDLVREMYSIINSAYFGIGGDIESLSNKTGIETARLNMWLFLHPEKWTAFPQDTDTIKIIDATETEDIVRDILALYIGSVEQRIQTQIMQEKLDIGGIPLENRVSDIEENLEPSKSDAEDAGNVGSNGGK